MFFTICRQDRKRQKTMAILQWMERYSWRITNDCNALSCILKQELFKTIQVALVYCDIPSGLQAIPTTWELVLSVPMSASQTLEPWLEFHKLILSAPPKRENNTTRSLSGQQAFSRRRLGDGSRILVREMNEFDISFPKYVSTNQKCTDEAWEWPNPMITSCIFIFISFTIHLHYGTCM